MEPASLRFTRTFVYDTIFFVEKTNKDHLFGGPYSLWSGRRDSNSRPLPWQGNALPLSYFRKIFSRLQPSDSNLVFFFPKAGCSKVETVLYVERKKRFELSTLALARQCSTAELLPHVQFLTLSRGREGTRTLTISHWLLRPARLPFRHPPEGVVRHQGLEPWAR